MRSKVILIAVLVGACATTGGTDETEPTSTAADTTSTAGTEPSTTTSGDSTTLTTTTSGSSTTVTTTTSASTSTSAATTSTPSAPSSSTSTSTPGSEVEIDIENFSYVGADSASVGSTVRVRNRDGVTHTWTSTDGIFDSGNLGDGDRYEFTFDQPGTYDFFCQIHPGMQGSITIEG